MATVTHEQFGGDEEDMCEDSGPAYIYDYVHLSPQERFMKQSRLFSVRRKVCFIKEVLIRLPMKIGRATPEMFCGLCICMRVSRY